MSTYGDYNIMSTYGEYNRHQHSLIRVTNRLILFETIVAMQAIGDTLH